MIALLSLDRFHALVIETQIVTHPAVEHRQRPAASFGADRIASARHFQQRARHWIENIAAMRVGDRNTIRIFRRLRLDRRILHIAATQRDTDDLGLLPVVDGRNVAQRHELTGGDAALRGTGAVATADGFHQAGGGAAHSRRILVF